MSEATAPANSTSPSSAIPYPSLGSTGKVSSQPINFATGQKLEHDLRVRENTYLIASRKFIELKEKIESKGEKPLTSYSVKEPAPFQLQSELPFVEIINSMEKRIAELDQEIKFVATANIEMTNQLKDIEKISDYINSLNAPMNSSKADPSEHMFVRLDGNLVKLNPKIFAKLKLNHDLENFQFFNFLRFQD